jgi:hypothetical protein
MHKTRAHTFTFVIPGCAVRRRPESILPVVVMDSGLATIRPRFARTRWSRSGMTDRYFPCHFGGRFSENAFGPSM